MNARIGALVLLVLLALLVVLPGCGGGGTEPVVTVAPLVVSVFPPSEVLGPLEVRAFSPTVKNSLNANVTWSVQEGAAGGSITASG